MYILLINHTHWYQFSPAWKSARVDLEDSAQEDSLPVSDATRKQQHAWGVFFVALFQADSKFLIHHRRAVQTDGHHY